MRFLLGFLLIFCIISDAASVSCPSGYTDITSAYGDTFDYNYGTNCPDGYEPYDAPDSFLFYFSGRRSETAPTTCSFGYHRVNGECVAYESTGCPSSTYYRLDGNEATFYHTNADGATCPSGYVSYDAPASLWFKFGGTRISNPPTVCATGYYVNGVCTAHSTANCPTGYYDVGFDSTFAAYAANGSCPTGYANASSVQSCTASSSQTFCTTLCNTGDLQTGAGECVAACGISGITELHVGATATFPVYGGKTTAHAMGLSDGTNVCYVNMASGIVSDTLKYEINSTVYHTTD